MTSPPSVVFHSPAARSSAVVMAPQRSQRGGSWVIVVLVLLAVVVVSGFAFTRWLDQGSTVTVTPASCVDGEASMAAGYRARTEAIANVGETEVAGVVICR